MQILDRTGVGTLWSICKTKFALAGHTHNYAGSGSAGGSANSAISVVDYGQTSKTIQIGYSGSGITGEQIKYIAGYTTGSGNVNAKIKDVSKDALRSWLGLGTLAYSSATITDNKVTQNAVKSSDYTNWRSLVFSAANSATEGFTPSTTTDGVFIANTLSVQPSSGTIKANKFKGALEGNASTASNASTVNGHTVNANVPSNAKFTDTNTWRPIHDNLTSTSTSESLSANQGRVLKGLVDGKANSSHTHSWSQISGAPATATRWPSWGEVTGKPTIMGVGVEQIIDTSYGYLEINFQNQCNDTYGYRSGMVIIGKFNSYKYIQGSQYGTSYPVVNINYNICVIGESQSSWAQEPDLPGFIISDNVEQVGDDRYHPYTEDEEWYTKLYKIKNFNKTIYKNSETCLYYKLTENGMKQCDSNGNILK